MNIEEFRDYCLSLGDVTEKTPFGRFAARYDSILVFYVCGHMFCFVDMDDFRYVDLRSTPDEIDSLLLGSTAVGRPLNRSLRYWLRIELGADISDARVRDLVRRAYDIVLAKYSR